MIKETRDKIFIIVMTSLSLMIISIVFIINIVNFNQSREESYRIVKTASRILENPNNKIRDFDKFNEQEESDSLQKPDDFLYWKNSKFYFVFINDNKVVEIINNNSDGYSDIEIINKALKINKKSKNQGSMGNLVYDIKKFNKSEIVTFMDNTIANDRLKSMIIFSIFIGILSLGINFLIGRKISSWIVKPIEETFNKQKQFISDASHELKTPLAVIGANADTLEGEIGYNKWLSYIQNEVISMDKLVNDLLSFARVEKALDISNMKMFDISKTILGSTMVFESLAYENEVDILYEIEENLNFKGNAEEIKQLVGILIDNAISHTNKGGKITVYLKKKKNNIVLSIENEGKPIPKGAEEKIFERFYRVDESRNRNSKRYGLGLSIAKTIVEKHKGKISANSKDGLTIFTAVF